LGNSEVVGIEQFNLKLNRRIKKNSKFTIEFFTLIKTIPPFL
jgi:hypothetical protein